MGVGGKVMGVRVVKHEVVGGVEEGGEGCLEPGGGMRVEQESGGVGRVEEVGEQVDMGMGVKMEKEEEGVDLESLDDLDREEDEEGVLDDLEEDEEKVTEGEEEEQGEEEEEEQGE